MKYALLAYDLESTPDELATEDKAALHAAHSTLRENETTHGSATMITHYRFRPPPFTSAGAGGRQSTAHNDSLGARPASEEQDRRRPDQGADMEDR
jgi:hypothetical protein